MTTFACPTCALEVPEGFSYCPRCRAVAEGRAYDPNELDRHERQYVLALVVFSLGALAIPRLMRSRAFSPLGKLAVALLGIFNTGAVVAIVYYVLWYWLPDHVATLQRTFR